MAPMDVLSINLERSPCKVTLDAYYDDMHISAIGQQQATVARATGTAARALNDMVDNELLCTVAPAKGGVVASDDKTLKLVIKAMRGLPGLPMYTCANLGVDYTGGRKHRWAGAPTQKARLQKYLLRQRKILAMKRATGGKAVHKLSMTGGRPSLGYAAACYGLSNNQLLVRRRILAQTLRPAARGRSLSTLCLLHGDPAVNEAIAPAVAWSREVWDASTSSTCGYKSSLSIDYLHTAWMANTGTARTWQDVRGPVTAADLTLARLGWTSQGPFTWTDHAGIKLDLLLLAPAMMQKKLAEAHAAQLEADVAKKLGGRFNRATVDPARHVIFDKKDHHQA